MKKFKTYYDTKSFASIANVSIKTLGRLKKELLTINPSTRAIIIKNNKNQYHHSLLKRFVSADFYQILMTNKSLRNTINCLKKTTSLENHLFRLPWTWFGTVAYKYDFNKETCFDNMHQLYRKLESKYGSDTIIRMFFTTEGFLVKEGNHNHFVLFVSNPKLIPEIEKFIKSFLGADRIDLDIYDDDQPCIFYIGKEGLEKADWDILGNKLIQEGLNYENNSN